MKLNNQKILDNLIQVSSSIKVLYDKLFELDKNSLKNSNEYEKTLEYLKIALDCEVDYYSQIQRDDLNDIIHYVEFKLYLMDGNDNDIILDNISSIKNEKLKYIRILTKLCNMKKASIGDSKLNTDGTVLKFNNNLINYYFMQLMNFYIKGNDMNYSMLIAKYNLSFLVGNLEKENVISKFNDRDLVIFEAKDDLNNSDKYIKVFNNIFFGTDKGKILIVCDIIKIIHKILSFSDEQFSDTSKMTILKVYSFYLRACFKFLDNEYLISNLNENFHETIEYYNRYDHSKSISLISEAFSKIKKDKLYMETKVYQLKM